MILPTYQKKILEGKGIRLRSLQNRHQPWFHSDGMHRKSSSTSTASNSPTSPMSSTGSLIMTRSDSAVNLMMSSAETAPGPSRSHPAAPQPSPLSGRGNYADQQPSYTKGKARQFDLSPLDLASPAASSSSHGRNASAVDIVFPPSTSDVPLTPVFLDARRSSDSHLMNADLSSSWMMSSPMPTGYPTRQQPHGQYTGTFSNAYPHPANSSATLYPPGFQPNSGLPMIPFGSELPPVPSAESDLGSSLRLHLPLPLADSEPLASASASSTVFTAPPQLQHGGQRHLPSSMHFVSEPPSSGGIHAAPAQIGSMPASPMQMLSPGVFPSAGMPL